MPSQVNTWSDSANAGSFCTVDSGSLYIFDVAFSDNVLTIRLVNSSGVIQPNPLTADLSSLLTNAQNVVSASFNSITSDLTIVTADSEGNVKPVGEHIVVSLSDLKKLTGVEIKQLYEAETDVNRFTDVLKEKLDSLVLVRYLGIYQTIFDIRTAHPAPASGSFGFLDDGVGSPISIAIWDPTEAEYKVIQAFEDESNALVKQKYEANADTNVFTDAEKSKLSLFRENWINLFPGLNGRTFNQLLRIDATGENMEWSDLEASFLDLNDVPAQYTGNEDKVLRVKSDGTGISFETAAQVLADGAASFVWANDYQVIERATGFTLTSAVMDSKTVMFFDQAGNVGLNIQEGLLYEGTFRFVQAGAGTVTIIPNGGVVLMSKNGALTTDGPGSVVEIIPRGPDTFLVTGDLV